MRRGPDRDDRDMRRGPPGDRDDRDMRRGPPADRGDRDMRRGPPSDRDRDEAWRRGMSSTHNCLESPKKGHRQTV